MQDGTMNCVCVQYLQHCCYQRCFNNKILLRYTQCGLYYMYCVYQCILVFVCVDVDMKLRRMLPAYDYYMMTAITCSQLVTNTEPHYKTHDKRLLLA